MGLTLIEGPAEEPVTLAEAKVQCKVDADIVADDALITALIVAARRQAEHLTGRALVTQRWRYTRNAFPADILDLPNPRLQSVQSVTYLDGDGIRQTLDPSDYQVVPDALVGFLLPAYGGYWPSCRRVPGSVEIDFTAGYGDAAAVPQDIKTWILIAVATLYLQREAVVTGTIVAELPRSFWSAFLDPYLVERV